MMLGVPARSVEDATRIADAARERCLLINVAGGGTLRFLPPLILTEEEAREGLSRLRSAVEAVAG
jgi:acetylornithine aminotransferase